MNTTTTPYCCVAFLMRCPVQKQKSNKSKIPTSRLVNFFTLFHRDLPVAMRSDAKGSMSLPTLNFKLPCIKGLSFSKQVFGKDILFFNIKAPTLELRLHLI